MIQALFKFIYTRLLGWKLVGTFPKELKYIVAVVPHTSWRDFFIGILVRSISGESINFVGKKELFSPLTAWFFKGLGGAPIDRSGNKGAVESMVAVFEAHEKFRIALAPEGTRKKVAQLRTGFYHIAKKAKVPIVPVAFDYENKEVIVHPNLKPSTDEKKDLQQFAALFIGVKGYSTERSF
ncbi:MAG: acyltransferase [Flavobacteriaceae bacterium]|jgi:1-acyl-sn-glycerol-3-phosphate acyltransferase|nr:acyltransferase [Flavobacteriaceae bacterium]